MSNKLKETILSTLEYKKWMNISEFIQTCLYHPKLGYYQKKNPFGMGGDFVTSSQISTLFGELIGLYFGNQFQNNFQKHKDKKFTFIELGSGNGFFLRDMLNSASRINGFQENVEIISVEISDKLIEEQKRTLQPLMDKGFQIEWQKDATELMLNYQDSEEEHFFMVFSNEFFDAFPINQYIKHNNQWNEIIIANKDKDLVYAVHEIDASSKVIPYFQTTNREIDSFKDGDIVEISNQASIIFDLILQTIDSHKGSMMTIDYGYTTPPLTSTLRGMKDHKEVDIFQNIGECDLTYLVDFEFLYSLATRRNMKTYAPIEQGKLLDSIGLQERVKILLSKEQDEAKRFMIEQSAKRLTSPSHMGELFKVLITENTDE